MSVITSVPEANIWNEICKEFSQYKPPFREDDELSVHTDYQDYDPSIHNPVFYGKMHHAVTTDEDPKKDIDVATTHPACIGYAFTEKPPQSPPPPPTPPPNKDKCTPREYLEHYVFPVLLPALEAMLKQAKVEKCFERKRTKFDALDFLTHYLYMNNPHQPDREKVPLEEIPFVKEWLKDQYLWVLQILTGKEFHTFAISDIQSQYNVPLVTTEKSCRIPFSGPLICWVGKSGSRSAGFEWIHGKKLPVKVIKKQLNVGRHDFSPRPPLPLSLIWTEEEAALYLQSFWRGYQVRREPEVQELRQWQKEWREENRGIQNRVSDFWDKKMPDWNQPTPNASQDQLYTEEAKHEPETQTEEAETSEKPSDS